MFSFHNIAKTLFGGAGARKNSPILPSFDIVDGDNTYYAFIDTRAGFDFLSNLIKRARDQKDPLKTEIHNIVYGEKGLQQNERRIDFLTAHQKNLLFKLINNYNIHICKYKAYVQLTTPQDKTRYEHILFKTGYGAKFLKLFGLAYGNLHDKFISAKKQIEALEPRDQILFLKAFNQFFRTGCRSVIITGASPAIAKQLENAKKKTYTVKTRAVAGAGGRLPLRPAKAPKNKKTSQQLSRGAARLDEFAKRDQERFDKQAIQIGIRHLVGSDAVVIKETEDKIFVKDKKSKKIFSLDKAQVINVGNVNKGLLESAADGLLAGTEDMAKGVSLVRDMVLEKTPLAAKVTEAWNKADSEYRKKHGGDAVCEDAVCEDADMAQAWIKSAFRNGKSAPYADTKNYGEKADVLPVLPVFGIFAPEVNALPSDIKAGAVDGAVKLVAGSVDCVTNPPQMAHSLLVLLTPDGRSAFLDNLSKTFTSGDVTKITSETVVLTFVALGAVKGGGEILNPSVKSLKLKIAKNKVTAVVNERAYTDPVVVGKVLKDIDDYKLRPSEASVENLNLAMKNKFIQNRKGERPLAPTASNWRVVPARNNALNFLNNILDLFRNKNKPTPALASSGAALEAFASPRQRLSAEENYLFAKGRGGAKTGPRAERAKEKPAEKMPNITYHDLSILEKLIDINNKGLSLPAIEEKYGLSKTCTNVLIKMRNTPKEKIQKSLSEYMGRGVSIEEIDEILAPRKKGKFKRDYSDEEIMSAVISGGTQTKAAKIARCKQSTISERLSDLSAELTTMEKQQAFAEKVKNFRKEKGIIDEKEIDFNTVKTALIGGKKGRQSGISKAKLASTLIDCNGGRTDAARALYGSGENNATVSLWAKELRDELAHMKKKDQDKFVEDVNKFRLDEFRKQNKEGQPVPVTLDVIKEAINPKPGGYKAGHKPSRYKAGHKNPKPLTSVPSQAAPSQAAHLQAVSAVSVSSARDIHLQILRIMAESRWNLDIAAKRVSRETLLRQLGKINQLIENNPAAITEYVMSFDKKGADGVGAGVKVTVDDIVGICKKHESEFPPVEPENKLPAEEIKAENPTSETVPEKPRAEGEHCSPLEQSAQPPKPFEKQVYIPVSTTDVAEELIKSGGKADVNDIAKKLSADIAEVKEKIAAIQEMPAKKLEKLASTLNARMARHRKTGLENVEIGEIITAKDILSACPDEAFGKTWVNKKLTATPECLAKIEKIDLEFAEMVAETTSKPENLKAIAENLKLPDDIRKLAAERLEELKRNPPPAPPPPVDAPENPAQRTPGRTQSTFSEYWAEQTNDPEKLKIITGSPSASQKAKKIAQDKLDAMKKAEESEEKQLAEDMAKKRVRSSERQRTKPPLRPGKSSRH